MANDPYEGIATVDPYESIGATAEASTTAQANVPSKRTSALSAAAHGFSQGITLGLGKNATAGIQALIYKASGGHGNIGNAYEQFLAENTSEEETLKKEHPAAYGTGEVASYAVPYGGTGAAFKAGSGLVKMGLTGGKSAVELANIGKATKLGQSALETAAGMGLAEGAKTLAETGSPEQAIQVGSEQATGGALGGITLGSLGLLAKAAAPGLKGLVSKATGVDYKYLQEYANNPKAIQAASGSEKDIGQDLVTNMEIVKKENIEDSKQARAILDRMGPATLTKVRAAMEKIVEKKAMSPEQSSIQKNIQTWLDEYLPKGEGKSQQIATATEPMNETKATDIINNFFDKQSKDWKTTDVLHAKVSKDPQGNIVIEGPKTIPAQQMADVKKAMQDVANRYYGSEGVPAYIEVIKGAAREARMALEDAADKSGVPEYKKLMKTVSDRIQTRDDLDNFLGNVIQNKPDVASRMMETLHTKGARNSERLRALDAYDDMFGTDFRQRADDAITASKLGKEGRPSLLSKVSTGALNLPSLVVGGLGSALGAQASHGHAGGITLGTTLGIIGGQMAASPAAWTTGIMASRGLKKLADRYGVSKALQIMKTAATSKVATAGTRTLGNINRQNQQ